MPLFRVFIARPLTTVLVRRCTTYVLSWTFVPPPSVDVCSLVPEEPFQGGGTGSNPVGGAHSVFHRVRRSIPRPSRGRKRSPMSSAARRSASAVALAYTWSVSVTLECPNRRCAVFTSVEGVYSPF
jgi:hypothetical protein